MNYKDSTSAKEFSTIVSNVSDIKKPYIVLIGWKNSENKMVGHALVVDSVRAPKDLGNGWVKLYLYDPNNPYFGYFGENPPALNYRQSENRYVEVNIKTGQWKMETEINGDGENSTSIGYDENGNLLKESSILFVDVNDYPINFDSKAVFSPSEGSISISYISNDFEIYDSDNKVIYRMEDGEKTYIEDDIVSDYIPYGYVNGLDIEINEGKLVLPKGEYKVIVKSGAIAYLENGNYTGVVSKGNIVISNKNSTSLSISSSSNVDVNVVIENVESEDKYVSVETNLKIDKGNCDISMDNTKFDIKSELVQNIDIDIITETGEKSIKGISTDKVIGIDLLNVGNAVIGDVNSDGIFNMADAALVRRYVANLNVTIDISAADVNKDGKIDMVDYALMRRALANWDVELK